MDDLIKLVRTYRLTRGMAERLDLAERIVPLIERDLRFFVFAAIRPPEAEDVFQEASVIILKKGLILKGDGDFPPWARKVVRLEALNALRKHDRG